MMLATAGSKVPNFSQAKSGHTGSVAMPRAAYLRNIAPNSRRGVSLSTPVCGGPVTLRGIQYPAGGSFYWG